MYLFLILHKAKRENCSLHCVLINQNKNLREQAKYHSQVIQSRIFVPKRWPWRCKDVL